MTGNPFDHERDTYLGGVLREHLEAKDHNGFVRRVMQGIHPADSSWEVLGRWARPGVAAACAFLTGVMVWFALNGLPESPASLADAVRPGDAPERLFSASQPDNELMLEVVLER